MKWIPSLCLMALALFTLVFTGLTREEAPPAEAVCEAASCGKCGDGDCVPQCGETSTSCPKDCGVASEY